MDLFKQWDLEKQKYKKQQENLINIFHQQQVMLRQCKIKQNQRMKLIIQMVTRYTQILKNIENKNNNVRSTASFVELEKEIAEYQKKYRMETSCTPGLKRSSRLSLLDTCTTDECSPHPSSENLLSAANE
ncbi:synaptonemal complex protein 3-like [Peromyscus eremicus]|uniref:synaptonemal complex protein 3-like n=1 Tax=Peromyscus eremicus TaxID=42410 RepID=UPI0027DDBF10|nr:synaptonemal complex protein 3-like [Peromyscus eremicus]XP_059108597.1 synaptonemal complex protein 3-like [Peromyscus eremicus]XP_059108598.1 synaptonemal complex protein 3-like [Peromyscus eremicus]